MIPKMLIITILTVMHIMPAAQLAGAELITVNAQQKNLDIFNDTQLLQPLQRVVLGYVGKGWQLEKSIKWDEAITDIYYDNNQLKAVSKKRIKLVDFDNQLNQENIQKQEEELNKDQWDENSELIAISPNRFYRYQGARVAFSNQYCARYGADYRLSKKNAPGVVIKELVCAFWVYPGSCFSLDEKYFAWGQFDNKKHEIKIYNIDEDKEHELSFDRCIFSLAISPDNQYIAVGSEETVTIINRATEKKEVIPVEFNQKNKENRITTLAYSPCGKYLIAGTSEGRINRYEYQPDLNS